MKNTTPVGQKIKALRTKLRLTQAELAGKEFTKSFISQVEKGQTNPSLKSLTVIARRLGMPVSYFLSDFPDELPDGDFPRCMLSARQAASRGLFSTALEHYGKALEHTSNNDHASKGNIHITRAEILHEQGMIEDAIREIELAIEHLKLSYDVYNLVRAYAHLGHYYTQTNRFAKGIAAFKRGLAALDDSNVTDSEFRIRLLINCGITYSHLRAYDDSIRALERALELMNQEGEYYGLERLWHTLGYAYAHMGDTSKAVEFTQKAVDLYDAIGDQEMRYSAEINLALFVQMSGDLAGARRRLGAIAAKTKETHPNQHARANIQLATIAISEGAVSEALDHVVEALKTAPDHSDVPEWISLLVQCYDHGAFSEEALNLAESVAKKWKGENRRLAELHAHLGELYNRLGQPGKANEHLSRSVALYRSS